MKHQRKMRGLLAGAGALVTAVALALGGAAAANAAPAQPVPDTSNVTITKLTEGATAGGAATGAAAGTPNGPTIPSGATPLPGARFDYYLVPGTQKDGANDIGTNAGQTAAAGKTVAQAISEIGSNPATGQFPLTAAGTGQATVDDMPRGLYLVREAVTPAGYTAAAPFLLAVPLTNPGNGQAGWLDTIYIYPKNAEFSVDKSFTEVIPAGEAGNASEQVTRQVGGQFKYTVLGDLPAQRDVTSYVLEDTRAATLSLYGGNTSTVKVELVDAAGAPLTGSDQLASGDYTVADASNKLTVTLNSSIGSGVSKLNAAPADVRLRITYIATVAADAAATASPNVGNTAKATVVNSYGTTTAEGSALVQFGDILIHKQSSAAGNAALQHAKFRVYATQADAAAGNSNYLTINGVSEWETDASGNAVIRGLLYSNIVNGVPTTDPASDRWYYLVETVAPAGHQLLAEPYAVKVTGKQVAAAPDNNVQAVSTITDQANTNGFVLPLTGGMGTAILTIGGIAILAVVLLVARRRRSQDAAAE